MAILIDHIQNVIQSDGVPNLILGLSGTVVTINGDPVSTSTFNTGTLVLQAVSAGYATTASLASYATTSSIASTATSAALAYSLVGGIGVASLAGSSGTSVSGSTGAVTVWFNTATLVASAVSAQSATTATSAAVAYSLASTSTTQVGFAVSAFTATNAGFAYSFNTATLVASAVTAQTLASSSSFTVGYSNTATNIAGGTAGMIHMQSTTGTTSFINAGTTGQLLQSAGSTASFVSTTTLQVGNALFAITATNAFFASTSTNAFFASTSTNAAVAYALASTSTTQVGFAVSAFTATSAAVAYSLASTSTTQVGSAVNSVYASTATNIAGGLTGWIHIQSTTGTTSFINIGSNGNILQSNGSTATFVSTSTLQVGFATSAFTATNAFFASTSTNAAVAYSLASTSTTQVGFAVNAFTATSAAIAYAVASTATLQVGSALFAVTATSAAVAYSLASTSTTQVGFAVSAFTATSAATAYSWTGGTVPNAVTFNGQVTFSGSATFVNSTATLYTDNILEIHTPPGGMDAMWGLDDGKDIGFHFHYYKNSTDTNAALLLRNDSKYLEWFQAGDDSTSNGNSFTATTYGTFKTGNIILANTTGTSSPTTGALAVAGGVGIGGNVYVSGVVTATTFIGNLTGTASTATSAAVAYSLASTSTTQVGFAVNAFTATNAFFASTSTNAATAYTLANTSTFQVGFAVNAFTATSAATAYALVNTSTFQVGFAVNAFTATSAAIAYSVASTSSLQVGSAVNAVYSSTATNIAGGLTGWIHIQSTTGTTSFINIGSNGNILQSNGSTATFVSTSTLQVGFATSAFTATSAATSYTLANTSTFQVGFAGSSYSATTATSAAVAYSIVNTSTLQVGFAVNAFTATSAAIAYSVASTSSLQVGSAVNSVYASTATNIAGGLTGWIHIQSTTGTTSFINIGSNGNILQSNGSTATFVSTSTLQVGFATSAFTATSAAVAYSLANTSTFQVGVAVTATYANISTNLAGASAGYIPIQSGTSATSFINPGTAGDILRMQIGNTATFVSTSTLQVGNALFAVTATSAAVAYSLANTSTAQVGFAVSAFTATSAAVAYSIVNTSTLQVGFAVSAFTATSAALAYAVASTSTLQVGSALFAVTATSAATAYSLVNTSTAQVGFAVSAFTATSAATAYSLVNTSTSQVGFAVSAFTATSAATAYNLANTTTFLVGNALTSVNATNATNIANGTAGLIPIQSSAGVTSFINTGTVGYVLQMQTGNTATWVSTSSLGISGGGGATFTGGIVPNATTVTNYFTVYSSTSVTTRGVQEISGNADGSFLAPNNSGVMLHITGQSGQPGRLYIDGQGTSNYSAVIGRKSRGTTASPTQVLANDIVFRLGSTPYTDAAFPAISTTRLDFLADELQTVTTQGSRIEAWVTQLGTTSSSISKQMTIATSGTVIWNTFTSVSTSTGALQVAGGVGIGGALYVGGNLYTRGVQVLPANIQEFTASASQTVFTVSGGYTVGTVVVVANGIELGNADITATNGTTVTLATARNSGDIIRIKSGPASTDTGSASLKAFSIAMSVALG